MLFVALMQLFMRIADVGQIYGAGAAVADVGQIYVAGDALGLMWVRSMGQEML